MKAKPRIARSPVQLIWVLRQGAMLSPIRVSWALVEGPNFSTPPEKTPYGKKRHYFNRLYSVDFQNFQNVLDKMVNATYNGNYHVNGNALQIKDPRLFRSSSRKMGVHSHTQISKPIFL